MDSGGGPQVTTSEPWGPSTPFLYGNYLQQAALNLAPGPDYYPNQTVAGFTPSEQAAQEYLTRWATTAAPQQSADLANAQTFLLGDVLSPESNQYLQQTAEGAIRPIFTELTERALPAVRSGAIQAGQYGGSRQGLAEAQSVERAVQAALDKSAGIYSTAYGQGLDAMSRGMALAPQSFGYGMQPGLVLSGVGESQRALNQALLEGDKAAWDWYQMLPYMKANMFQQGTTSGMPGGTTSVPGQSTGSQVANAAGVGIGTYVRLVETNPALAAPAAGVMAVASLFS